MKKLFVKPVILLTLIASVFVMSSCEESVEVVEADLIGVWDIGQASADIKVGPVPLLDFLVSTMQFGQAAAEELVDQITADFLDFGEGTFTFNEDYSYLMSKGEFTESGTWNLEGDKLYLNISGEVPSEDLLKILSLDGTIAVIAMEQEQEIELGEGVVPINAKIIIEINLTKQ